MTWEVLAPEILVPEILSLAGEASDLVVRSDVMAVVVVAASAGAWLFAGWLRMRAAAPQASHTRCVLAGADLLMTPPLGARARVKLLTTVSDELAAAATAVALALLVPASVAAVVYLVLAGHPPDGAARPFLGAAAAAAVAGLSFSAWRVARVPGRKGWLAVRGPHMTGAAVVGELTLAATTTATAWALTHTEGTTASLLEIGLACVLARGLTLTRVPRGGVLLADVVFLAALLRVGLSAGAAVATVAIWRSGVGLAWLVAVAGRRTRSLLDVPVSLPSEPTGSPVGEWLHRTAFQVIAALPPRLARRTRAGVFQALFSLAEDPWRYDGLAYERHKRQVLVDWIVPTMVDPETNAGSSLRVDRRPLVELGCADGHNLQAFSDRYPDRDIIGLDISGVAAAAAGRRTAHQGNVTVLTSDARGAATALRAAGVTSIRVLVVAEMLYYLGGPDQVRAELRELAPMLRPSGMLVLVHGVSDAERLHGAAVEALGCATVDRVVIDDQHRPFVVQTAKASIAR
ncbi:class I SAM-dependent methyltransferase [Terrabacter sp. NPDC000476]|uniref:class I SAM-dependent methyltransferase n=1 Tax=Terrabacter sp. NPDC000476 TaxID=3154258 RepID=UPI00331B1439